MMEAWLGSVLEEAGEDFFVSSPDGADEGSFSFSMKQSFLFQVVSSSQTLFHLRCCGGAEEID